jgi:hypothetical protein
MVAAGGTVGTNTGPSQTLGRTVSSILPSLVTAIRALTNEQLQKQLESSFPTDNNTIGGQADRHALLQFAQSLNNYLGSRSMSAGGGIHSS